MIEHVAENSRNFLKVGTFIQEMFCPQFNTFFSITFKGMIGDHNHPAVFLFLFDVIENINAAFAGQINIEHGNLWIQLIDKSSCFIVRAGGMKTCGIKIF